MNATPASARGAAVAALLDSAAFARALSLCAIGTVFLSHAIRSVAGWPTLLSVIIALAMLSGAALFVRRHTLEWRGLLTISLIAFVGWCAISTLWSDYGWATLGGVLYQLAIALIGITIALLRDQIQILRAFGDVLRVLLVSSLILEVLSGLLIDTPIAVLGIAGRLDTAGPIQGLFGTRNQLGVVALLALVTFVVELRTRSLQRGISIGSIILGSLMLLFSRSPVAVGALAVVVVAALTLYGLRRLSAERKRFGEVTILGAVVVALAIMWAARSPIIDALNAGSEFEYRYTIWKRILDLVSLSPIEGFGWLGYWRTELPPYIALGLGIKRGENPSAYNAYLDALLQVGVVGLVLLLLLVGLALTRSWLLAANKRSVVYVWPALMLVALVVVSAAESMILVEFGWLVLVICAVKASEGLSWRRGLAENPVPGSE
ncbi:MAG: O-antigen ligase family protein [Rhodoglobus sp.]